MSLNVVKKRKESLNSVTSVILYALDYDSLMKYSARTMRLTKSCHF